MLTEIKFRPHHFLCALCFQGKGYSPKFVHNFKETIAALEKQIPIRVVDHTDTICNACPHKQPEQRCSTEDDVQILDQAHAEALNIKAGDRLTWHQAKTLIAERIDLQTFHQICQTCSWKASGICEQVLKDFRTLEKK